MADPLLEHVEQFCVYQRKQRGRTASGVQTYRWNLNHFMRFVQSREGRPARVADVTEKTLQAWMDDMAAGDLALSTLRTRQSTLSSFCGWLMKRGVFEVNPVVKLDRPPHRREAPRQVPSAGLMDQLIRVARERKRPRDVALFLILRFTGMRRESVAGLRVRNLAKDWGLRNVPVKGGKTRDIPLPKLVREYLAEYVEKVVAKENDPLTDDTPIFWSTYGRRHVGTIRRPMTGRNIWRLCKVYGRLIDCPELKPHDLRHGVAMEVYGQHHDLEQVRALLGHTRIDTTQVYAQIQPRQLKEAVSFYKSKAVEILS
jgi:integrase/recombinase XerC